MILQEPYGNVYQISKILYNVLLSQKPETVLSLHFENGSEELQIRLWDDDEVQIIDDYLVRKTAENDYEIVAIGMYTHIEVLTIEG